MSDDWDDDEETGESSRNREYRENRENSGSGQNNGGSGQNNVESGQNRENIDDTKKITMTYVCGGMYILLYESFLVAHPE